ncbi:MAG: hypothetical protein QOI44_1220, partial [Actinomycetota bacterium]|nr:hypothetical protein [Actinomycetota bacterium]
MWRPSDFILRGRYCRTEDIREYLERERVELRADEVAIVTFDVDKPYRSLTLVTRSTPQGAAIDDAIQTTPFTAQRRRFLVASSAAPHEDLDRVLDELAEYKAFASLRPGRDDPPWIGLALAQDAKLNALLLARASRRNFGQADLRSRSNVIRDLTLMVNATVNTSVQRDHEVVRSVDRLLPQIPAGINSPLDKGVAAELLEVLKRAIRADGVALYTLASDGASLVSTHVTARTGLVAVREIELTATPRFGAAIAFRRNRIVLRSAGQPTYHYRTKLLRLEPGWVTTHKD